MLQGHGDIWVVGMVGRNLREAFLHLEAGIWLLGVQAAACTLSDCQGQRGRCFEAGGQPAAAADLILRMPRLLLLLLVGIWVFGQLVGSASKGKVRGQRGHLTFGSCWTLTLEHPPS